MSSELDRALEVLDVGRQRPTLVDELGSEAFRPELCWRCQRRPANRGGACPSCASQVLDELYRPALNADPELVLAVAWERVIAELERGLRGVVELVLEIGQALADSLDVTVDELVALLEGGELDALFRRLAPIPAKAAHRRRYQHRRRRRRRQ